MPYIDREARKRFEKILNEFRTMVGVVKRPPGDLNYLITQLILINMQAEMAVKINALRYSDINEAMGVLECVKHEFYRRLAVPLEEFKAKENGDVYP